MDTRQCIEPVTVLKTKSAQLIRQAATARQPIVITQNGRATAVLQDIESYEEQRQALHLLKIVSQGDGELRSGRGVDHAEAKLRFEKTLKALRDD